MRVVVVGGGVGGLTTGMLLAKDGHDVTLLERDEQPPPDAATAWESWERRGVNQFRLAHYLQPRFLQLLDAELPEAAAELRAAGALDMNQMEGIPDELTGGVQPGDERFSVLTARRPVAEAALARAAEATPGLTVRRGVSVEGLRADDSAAPPHVTGVRTADAELDADLVVDAAGRRSQLPAWLVAIGATAPIEELEDSGFTYYNRHFRSADGSLPVALGGALQHYGSISMLMLPGDNGCWGLGVICSSKDPAMRLLRDTEVWTRVIGAFPLVAHWLDGEPLHEVTSMTKIEDRHRTFVVDGAPVATGVVGVADSWACTNPSIGRGASIGLLHAVTLRDTLRSTFDEPGAFELAFHEATQATVEPWYRATLEYDRHRLGMIEAIIAGEDYEPDDPGFEISQAMESATTSHPDVLRGRLDIVGVLATPEEVLARPGLIDKVIAAGAHWRDEPVLGPDRAALVALVNG